MQRIQHIQEMLKNEPNDSFLNYALALEYAKINEIKKAIELIEGLLERDENYLGAYYQLGKYYEQMEQPKNAVLTYKKGILVAKKQSNKKADSELNEAIGNVEF